jgi:phosphonate degradation associated HDIG domain protein
MRKDGVYWLRTCGASSYGGEAITQLAHALQSAALAEADGASDALTIAALMHDVGHLLGPETSNVDGDDRQHERLGARFLARSFGPAVSEPVRLHVEAKRYLARDPAYFAGLSPESKCSLEHQGGPYEDWQADGFEAHPFADDAVRLRQWDDQAKLPDANVPGLDHYAERILRLTHPRLTVNR